MKERVRVREKYDNGDKVRESKWDLKTLRYTVGFEDGVKKPWVKEYRWPTETGKGKGNRLSSGASRVTSLPTNSLASALVKWSWDFWLPGVEDNKCMLFEVTKLVDICHNSYRKLIHLPEPVAMALLLGSLPALALLHHHTEIGCHWVLQPYLVPRAEKPVPILMFRASLQPSCPTRWSSHYHGPKQPWWHIRHLPAH